MVVGQLARGVGPAAGMLAALAAALHPPLVWISAYVLSETLYSTLAMTAALALSRALETMGTGSAARPAAPLLAAGVAAGVAALARSVGLLFIALAAARLSWRDSTRAGALFLAAAMLAIAPWSVRTSLLHGRPILVAAEGGVNFWIGNHPLARGDGDLAANPLIKDANRAFRARYWGLSPEALEPFYWRDAWRHIAERPVRWMGLLARKLFYMWVPVGPSYTLHSRRYYLASVASYGVVLPLALAGFRRFRWRPARLEAVTVAAASTLLAELMFFPHERYRIPVLDPALLVYAAAWVAGRQSRMEQGACATGS